MGDFSAKNQRESNSKCAEDTPSHVELIHREQVVLGTDGAVAADIHLATIRELVIQ